MKGPNDVKCDRDGRFVVADTFNHRISWYDTVSIYLNFLEVEWPYYCIMYYYDYGLKKDSIGIAQPEFRIAILIDNDIIKS